MKKSTTSKWRITKVTERELANILWIFHERGELFCDDPTTEALETLPAPDRHAGDPVLDLKYLDNVIGEPAFHESAGATKVVLMLLDAGKSKKCSLVHIKFKDSSEGCCVSVRSTWRAAKADAVPDLEEALSVIKEERGNT